MHILNLFLIKNIYILSINPNCADWAVRRKLNGSSIQNFWLSMFMNTLALSLTLHMLGLPDLMTLESVEYVHNITKWGSDLLHSVASEVLPPHSSLNSVAKW